MTIPFNVLNYIEKNGKPYKPGLVPENIERGMVGDCFDTCMMAVAKHPHLKYVEGIARDPMSKEWILHAWVTDGEFAYDLTWKAIDRETNLERPVPTSYIGVEMETLPLLQFVKATGYKGVFANHFRDKELAGKLLINF